jgi:hypothetical protein
VSRSRPPARGTGGAFRGKRPRIPPTRKEDIRLPKIGSAGTIPPPRWGIRGSPSDGISAAGWVARTARRVALESYPSGLAQPGCSGRVPAASLPFSVIARVIACAKAVRRSPPSAPLGAPERIVSLHPLGPWGAGPSTQRGMGDAPSSPPKTPKNRFTRRFRIRGKPVPFLGECDSTPPYGRSGPHTPRGLEGADRADFVPTVPAIPPLCR